ncbi:MAG TPA: OsmC family protein [Candidatus Deferrimicrobium sp.]|nr:OsmC family protein [Candidatus Deferrimicrobium sp.]
MEEREVSVSMELIKDYEFKVTFDEKLADLLMDEPPPLGSGGGPNASKVLSAAVGNCLTASLLFCLRKIRLEPTALKTTVTTKLIRNEQGRIRIGASHVAITLGFDPAGRDRLRRCNDLFEDYCVVTQSVRSGIPVSVAVQDERGELIYDSRERLEKS